MYYMVYDFDGHSKAVFGEEEYKKLLASKEWFQSFKDAEEYFEKLLANERKKVKKAKAPKIIEDNGDDAA